MIDAETEESWIVAYCEAVSHTDAFGPYAYGCINDERDERIVFHANIATDQDPHRIEAPPARSNARVL